MNKIEHAVGHAAYAGAELPPEKGSKEIDGWLERGDKWMENPKVAAAVTILAGTVQEAILYDAVQHRLDLSSLINFIGAAMFTAVNDRAPNDVGELAAFLEDKEHPARRTAMNATVACIYGWLLEITPKEATELVNELLDGIAMPPDLNLN